MPHGARHRPPLCSLRFTRPAQRLGPLSALQPFRPPAPPATQRLRPPARETKLALTCGGSRSGLEGKAGDVVLSHRVAPAVRC
jgi:hypothetical protein